MVEAKPGTAAFSDLASGSVAALTAAAAAGAMAVDPVADCELGILSSHLRTAQIAVQPLFLSGNLSNC